MANPARNKGTKAETAVARYLQGTYWPYAERRSLAGALDKGDLTGTPGLCWEVKASATISWWSWMAEAVVERNNAKADFEILVVKPPGVGYTRVDGWYAAMSDASFRYLRNGIPDAYIHVTDPVLYRHGSFPAILLSSDMYRSLTAPLTSLSACAVTAYKPGMAEHPDTHIKVTYLRQMVTLLREYGYGTDQQGMQLLREVKA